MKIDKKNSQTSHYICGFLYGCKTRETSREWQKFQLLKHNQLRNPSELHVENSIDLQTVKKFPAFSVKRRKNIIIFQQLV
jgi:hypothetical protein